MARDMLTDVEAGDRADGVEAQADAFAFSQLAFMLLDGDERSIRLQRDFDLLEELASLVLRVLHHLAHAVDRP